MLWLNPFSVGESASDSKSTELDEEWHTTQHKGILTAVIRQLENLSSKSLIKLLSLLLLLFIITAKISRTLENTVNLTQSTHPL